MSFYYENHLCDQECNTRLGTLHTWHGAIQTPEFLPVGTQATVKALSVKDLKEIEVQGILANTYHLYLRPGDTLVRDLGGLHQFCGWKGPILTDSGGFQAFSLGAGIAHGVGKIHKIFPGQSKPQPKVIAKPSKPLAQVDEEGVTFRSHLDGSLHRFTPQSSIKIQENLGADMILAFDECTSPLAGREYTAISMERTHRWAIESLEARADTPQALYGIVQGGYWQDLREKSAQFIGELDFQGYAIGGSLGQGKEDMYNVLRWTMPYLPAHKPRHLLGIGDVEDIFYCVALGVDTFDCVMPTRMARNGNVLVPPGRYEYATARHTLSLKQKRFEKDDAPIMEDCDCFTCQNHSRAYLRHLLKAKEILASMLMSRHNIHFLMKMMQGIRQAIREGRYLEHARSWGIDLDQNFHRN